MPEHVSITDPNIHEPKGVASAQAGTAYIATGAGSGQWQKPRISVERVLEGASYVDQNPTGTDTPMQIEFGAAQNTSSDPVELSATGAITINETDTYFIKVALQLGRAGASGTSRMFVRVLADGVQVGRSIFAKIDDAETTNYFDDDTRITLPAGTVLTFELIRDSSGNDSGGLVFADPTPVGWNNAASAFIRVERQVV